MNVSSTSSPYQMQQMRMRNGSGNGQGNGGMKDIMQSLSQEDRTQIKDKMSSMSTQDRQAAINQMKQVDKSSISAQDYTQSLLDILNQDQSTSSTTATNTTLGFSMYA